MFRTSLTRPFALAALAFPMSLVACDDGAATPAVSEGAYAEVHAVFTAKCTPCHAGTTPEAGSGGAALGASSAAVSFDAGQLDANFSACSGKSVAECALIRIKDGSMPKGAGCDTDPSGADCVTAAEQALIEAWIQDGMPE
jgi:uncharacterized membrane protein